MSRQDLSWRVSPYAFVVQISDILAFRMETFLTDTIHNLASRRYHIATNYLIFLNQARGIMPHISKSSRMKYGINVSYTDTSSILAR